MYTLFLFCAVIGGVIFVLQFVMALIGMGDDGFDLADDLPDDIPDDLPNDFGEVGGSQGDLVDHGSTWLFGVISFRTVVAALAFFGLAGLAAMEAQQPPLVTGAVAITAGLAAMYGVHWLMRLLYRLGHDGTVRIERSVGQTGTVYIPIPGGRAGTGKVQLEVQGRIMEYQAVTSGPDKLCTGARVIVVGVVTPTTVEVELIRETAEV
jgi:hypothetical protein